MSSDVVRFSTLHADGSETDVRELKRSDLLACPHVIICADHYRADGTCRCDDPTHREMRAWGYTWRKGRWQ